MEYYPCPSGMLEVAFLRRDLICQHHQAQYSHLGAPKSELTRPTQEEFRVMTVETKYVAALTDIGAVRIACRKCGAAYAIPPGRAIIPPQNCRACNVPLFSEGNSIERDALLHFLDAIRDLLRSANGASYAISLELPAAPTRRPESAS